MQKQIGFGGENPQARFGHTITPIGKERAILFGGAVGDPNKLTDKYVITGDTFLCDYVQKKFKKLQPRGTYPTNRAAHAAVCVDQHLLVFGGALGGGQLADDTLYQLDILAVNDKAFWSVRTCNGTSPGPRYGHVMGYLRPYLIIHGGNTGNEPIGDVWVNDILGTAQWRKVDTGADNPPPRAYHSASICKTGTANGMMVIFGGRGADGQPMNDTWGLRKHRDNRLDWMKAPYRSTTVKPAERYQHRTLFIGTLLVVVGGRNNVVGESMHLDIYDTQTSDWYRLPKVDRFRHISFVIEQSIFVHGGFSQEAPTIPTDSIIQINLSKAFADHPNLFKGLAYELGRDIITHNVHQVRRNSIEGQNTLQNSQRRQESNMQIQHERIPKRNIQSNQKQIRLCPQALVANYNEQNDLKKVSIDELPAEHRKLTTASNIHSFSKDSSIDAVCKYFQSALYCKHAQLPYPIPFDYLQKMLVKLDKIFDEEATLIRIRAPVKVFGDLHGQVNDLNRLFQSFGTPDDGPRGDIESTNYLFLGDYVDRGTKSLQTLLLLFMLKLKYPQNVFLLRGSHEDVRVNKTMGFGEQCEVKLKQNIEDPRSFFQRSNKLFEKMPLAALVNESILCLHGGIGSVLLNINQISSIPRPIKVNHDPKSRQQRIVYDILWSDPCKGREPVGSHNAQHDYFKTKANTKFSEKRAYSFCSENQLVTIIRSGEPVIEGYESTQSMVTVFSCCDYGGCGNKSAIIGIMKNEQIVPMVLHPIGGRDRWIEGLDRKKAGSEEQHLLRSISFTPPK